MMIVMAAVERRQRAYSRFLPRFKLLDGLWEQASPLFLLTAATLVASLLLGGGTVQGFLSDAILQLAALPLLLWSLWKLFEGPLTQQMRVALAFCTVIALLPLVQLVPLPPWLWTLLPNRDVSADAYKVLGTPLPWMPISVSPEATWLSALSFVPPIAIFIATLQLSYRERRLLSLVLLAVGVIGVFLGLLQVAQGPESPWRFFEFTNKTEAVGFFANRNHFSALIYSLVPIAAAWTVKAVGDLESKLQQAQFDLGPILGVIAGFTVIVILLAGQMMARSRLGLALTIIALFGTLALGFVRRGIAFSTNLSGASWQFSLSKMWSGFTPKILIAAIALVLTFSFQFAFFRMQERFSADVGEDARHVFVPVAVKAARGYMPFGAGSGTFVSVYPLFERPQDTFAELYANRAHNDAVELWLETGIFGLILIGLFVTWWGFRATAIWLNSAPPGTSQLDWLLARAATIIIPLLLVHSLFDYPLRTNAIAAVMALACAFLVEPEASAEVPEWSEIKVEKTRPRKRRRPDPVPSPAFASEAPRAPAQSAPVAPAAPAAPDAAPRPAQDEDRKWGTDINWPKEWTK